MISILIKILKALSKFQSWKASMKTICSWITWIQVNKVNIPQPEETQVALPTIHPALIARRARSTSLILAHIRTLWLSLRINNVAAKTRREREVEGPYMITKRKVRLQMRITSSLLVIRKLIRRLCLKFKRYWKRIKLRFSIILIELKRDRAPRRKDIQEEAKLATRARLIRLTLITKILMQAELAWRMLKLHREADWIWNRKVKAITWKVF